MGRRKALLEQQPHRVALIAEDGLQADEHIAELGTQHMHPAPIGLDATGGGAPSGLDFGQPRGLGDDLGGGDSGVDVRGLTMAGSVAVQDSLAQRLDTVGRRQVIAFGLEGVQGVEKAFEHAKIGRSPRRACIRRKAIKHDSQLPRSHGRAVQFGQPRHLVGQSLDPLGAGRHGPGFSGFNRGGLAHPATAVATLGVMATGENGGVRRAVDLRQCDQHGGFHRAKPTGGGLPLAERLELQRMRGDVGHVQDGQGRNSCRAVVVGGATDQAEAGQRHHRIDATLEVGLHRGAAIKAPGEGGDAGDALGLEGADDGIIMRGIGGKDVGPQHQQTDRRGCPLRTRQVRGVGRDSALQRRMVQPHIRVIDRGRSNRTLPAMLGRITTDKEPDHRLKIVIRRAKPVLHRQEPGAHVLRLSRDPAQNLRQPPQHSHLLLPRA